MIEILKQVLTVSFVSACLYASGFFVLWTPLPLFFVSFHKRKEVWWLSIVGIFLTAVLVDRFLTPLDFFDLFYIAFYLTAGIFLSVGFWKKWPTMKWGALQCFGGVALLFLMGVLIQQTGIFDIRQAIQTSLEGTASALETLMQKPEFFRKRPEMIPILLQMKQVIFFFPKIIPALLFILSVAVMVCNIGFLRTLDIRRQELRWVGKFRLLRLPLFFIWFLITSGGCYFLNAYFFRQGWLQTTSLNGVIMAGSAYFLQGLSISGFFMRRFSLLFRLVIYGLVLLFLEVFGLVIVGLGIADVWADFRKLNKEKR